MAPKSTWAAPVLPSVILGAALAGCNAILGIGELPGPNGDAGSGSVTGSGAESGVASDVSSDASTGAATGGSTGSAVSSGVGSGVRSGVGSGVSSGAGSGVSSGVGSGVSSGVGSGVSSGVGSGAGSGASGSATGSSAGSASGTSGSASGSASGSPGDQCAPTQTKCSDSGNGVQTCGAAGQWGSPSLCSATTPYCRNSACTSTPPSCQLGGIGLTNCGARSESCCTSPLVTGGTYFRTYTNTGAGAMGQADSATVGDFRLDKYAVTVGRFRLFVDAWTGGWTPAPGAGKHAHLNGRKGLAATGGGYEPGWVATDSGQIAPTPTNLACNPRFATWTNSSGSQENLPITCVNWFESFAFCIWDGGFLPSEAEWEYAATGGNQQLEYPWGSTAPGTACPGTGCQYAIYGCYYPDGSGVCATSGPSNIASVGTATLGAGLWGQLDLAGNVFEWNLDWYGAYAASADAANFTLASYRVFRGAYFNGDATSLRPTLRGSGAPTDRNGGVGFRCSRAP